MRPPDLRRRRAVLGAALGLAGVAVLGGTGCDLFDRSPDPPPTPDPLEPLRAQALGLADRYALVIAAAPALAARLGPLRDAHLAHVTALNKIIGTPPASTVPSPAASIDPASIDPATSVAALRAAEEAAQRDAVTACLAAPADRAGLVGSIAASRATHVVVLA